MTAAEPTWVTNVSTRLALHRLRDGDGEGRPLLLLHGLGEATPVTVPEPVSSWPGPIWGLDVTGHGRSEVPAGGGYTCEGLVGDVDAALAELGPVTLHGRGLGAYLALLTAGSRPSLVVGAILTDGVGLAGGGSTPHTSSVSAPPVLTHPATTPDPYALLELSQDVRPPDYAATYVRQAVAYSGVDEPITVAAVTVVPWLDGVLAEPGARRSTTAEALARYAAATPVPVAEPPAPPSRWG